jgi:hypothetical protein
LGPDRADDPDEEVRDTMVYRFFLAMANRYTGSECRRCGAELHAGDPFGVSERVCGPCRA